jgi:aminopeptidase
MFDQISLKNYADILIWGMEKARSKKGLAGKGDIVRLLFTRLSYPLAEIVHKKCVQKGYNVVTQVMLSPKMEYDFYEYADDEQLEFIPPWLKEKTNCLNGSIIIYGSESLTHLKDVDPKKIARNQKQLKIIRDILNKRESIGKYGWCLGMWPSQDMADQADMKLDVMFNKVKKACYLDMEDPISKWESIYKEGQKTVAWLKNLEIDTLKLKSKNCDLTVKIGENRKFVSLSGHNIPSFEVWVSPDKYGTEGVYYSDQPTFRNGNYVKGIYLKFQQGKVIEAKAEQGEAFLSSQLKIDKGASFLGEFSLTDKRHSRIDSFMANTLYDENTCGNGQGNSHIAIGASLPDSYDGNEKWEIAKTRYNFNESALHWDLVNIQKKEVVAKLKNGKECLIYIDGKFTL